MLRLFALIVGTFLANATAAQPAAYPSRTIHLVAGTAPGGITDYLARVSADGLSARLGRQVVVENKAGATGNLAIEHVAKSAPDGYTLLLVAGGNVVITPFLYASLPFDPLNDIVPVFNIAGAPQLLVVPGTLPVKDLADFIALARAGAGVPEERSAACARRGVEDAPRGRAAGADFGRGRAARLGDDHVVRDLRAQGHRPGRGAGGQRRHAVGDRRPQDQEAPARVGHRADRRVRAGVRRARALGLPRLGAGGEGLGREARLTTGRAQR